MTSTEVRRENGRSFAALKAPIFTHQCGKTATVHIFLCKTAVTFLTSMCNPQVVFVLSGKRKSGKDYFADLVLKKLTDEKCGIVRLSAPLKKRYAEIHNLDFASLLGTSPYKERYRKDMIKWGEDERRKDPEVFCKLATEDGTKKIWVVTDARRPSDLAYFKNKFGDRAVLIRIVCPDKTRAERGWSFIEGVDDAESECALDDRTDWNYIVQNDQKPCQNSPLEVLEQLIKQYSLDS